MPFQPPDYEMHRALIEHQKAEKKRRRAEKKKRDKNVKRAYVKRLPLKMLRGEIVRRGMAKMTPEEREAWITRANAARALKPQFCDHMKLPPKLRKTGKHAGEWVCPSCHTPVPAPRQHEEDLVV